MIDEKEAVDALNKAFPILIENFEHLDAAGSAQLRTLILHTRELGLEIDAVTDFVSEMTGKAVEALNKLAGGIGFTLDDIEGMIEEILGDTSDMTEEEIEAARKAAEAQVLAYQESIREMLALTDTQLELFGDQFNLVVAEILANGGDILDVIDELAPLLEAAKKEGIDLGGQFGFLKELAAKLEQDGMRPLAERVGALNDLLAATASLGLLNEERFNDFQVSIVDAFDQMIDAGFTAEEAIFLSIPALQEIVNLADRYGFEIDEATQGLIDQAREAGFNIQPQETMKDIMEDIRDIMEDIRDALTGVGDEGEDAFDRIRESGMDAMRDLREAIREMGGDLPVDFRDLLGGGGGIPNEPVHGPDQGFARGGVVPPTPSGAMIAQVHSGEVIGVPEQMISAFQTALANISLNQPEMPSPIFSPTIEVRLGRRVLRQAVKEVIKSGTADGDISVHRDSVRFFQ
jgi:ElaB/YqjD/DUF883 family membrane-anchored ribosome-binding protein